MGRKGSARRLIKLAQHSLWAPEPLEDLELLIRSPSLEAQRNLKKKWEKKEKKRLFKVRVGNTTF